MALVKNHSEESLTLRLFDSFSLKSTPEKISISHTNNRMKGTPLSFRELHSFIGVWVLTTSHTGYNIRYFFVDKSIDIFEGASIRLNFYMAGHRFENTIAAL